MAVNSFSGQPAIPASYGFTAGKNKIINGDFSVWQRGTTFNLGNGTTYTADRWRTYRDGSGATVTVSQQTFTPGTAPVSGYEGTYFLRYNQSVAGTGATYSALGQPVEDVRTFAGQTVTVSFWAKSNASRNINVGVLQDYGAGGSGSFYPPSVSGNTAALTTSWQRFNFQFNITATTGKTIGTNSYIQFYFDMPLNQTYTLDVWGFQVEAGATATSFQTATGTIGGELALCQRYYQRFNTTTTFGRLGMGMATGTTNVQCVFPLKTTMRTVASALDFSGATNFVMNDGVNNYPTTAITLDVMGTTDNGFVIFTVSSGLTQYRPYTIAGNNNGSAYIGFSAEL